MLRPILILLLTLIPTFFNGPELWAQESPRIFFKKIIRVPEEKLIRKHIVKPGEHLYQILRDHGVTKDELSHATNLTSELNPHIPDINLLIPGQELLVPLSTDIARKAPGSGSANTGPYQPHEGTLKEYTVKRGDRLVDIFRNLGLNDSQIFGEYLRRFRDNNPEVIDVDRIEIGQRIVIPLPRELAEGEPPVRTVIVSSAAPQQGRPDQPDHPGGEVAGPLTGAVPMQGLPVPKNQHDQDSGNDATLVPASPEVFAEAAIQLPTAKAPVFKKELSQADRRTFMLSLLRTVGFRFTPGEELLYPNRDGSWFKVDLARTPLGRAPWGEQYVFLPEELKNLEKDFRDIGHEPVLVDEQWEPRKVLESISEKSGGQFRTWPQARPLIVNKGGLTLELKASILARLQNKRILLLNMLEPGEPPTPALLQGFFDRKGVHVHEWVRQPNLAPKPLQTDLPRAEDLLVMWIDRYNAWTTIRERLSEEHRSMAPDSSDIESVLAMLHRMGMVSRDPLRVSWFKGKEREMVLTIPAVSIIDGNTRLVVLSVQQASPHLVALLLLKGYTCLALR
jgi:hypothetical protein